MSQTHFVVAPAGSLVLGFNPCAFVRHPETGYLALVEYDGDTRTYRMRSNVDSGEAAPSAFLAIASFIDAAMRGNSAGLGFSAVVLQRILPPLEEHIDDIALQVEGAIRSQATDA